ncbi:hypothetical protein B0T19DRAFT_422696 [Cercophora scortea]|uniref:Uncharacterized protein n=1 Tax=Cercophora scortea TaxID=314031 RepID=A0AAE0ME57_9PEZI|nr:hypothetical protein B0T19DRAFT_422696 [Cercophora scortea]
MSHHSSSSISSSANTNTNPLTGAPLPRHTPTPTSIMQMEQNSHYICDLGSSPARTNKPPKRTDDPSPTAPTNPTTVSSSQTEYMKMLLALDKIPRLHNILASFFAWILLAGFVIIPGSFSTNTPLTAVTALSGLCITIGVLGIAYLAVRWRANYVWLLNKVYMPVLLNGLAGVVATMTSVYTAQRGQWNIQAVVAVVVEGVVVVVCAGLFGVYDFWLLRRVKGEHCHHERERGVVGGGGNGNGKRRSLVQRVEDITTALPVAPGSVV